MQFIVLMALLVFPFTAQAQGINVRPSSETSYTIQASDCGKLVIATNPTAPVNWTLPGLSNCPGLKIKNRGREALFVTYTNAGNLGEKLLLEHLRSIDVQYDGERYEPLLYVAGWASAAGSGITSFSYATMLAGWNVLLTGPIVAGKIVGFDYNFTYQAQQYSLQFRHTMQAGESNVAAAADLVAQLKANATLKLAIGPDVLDFAVGETGNARWPQTYTFVSTGNPQVVGYSSDGTGVTVVPPTNTLDTSAGGNCGHTGIYAGRFAQVGDAVCGWYVMTDSNGQAPSVHDSTPFLWASVWRVTKINPTQLAWNIDQGDVNLRGQPLGCPQAGLSNTACRMQYNLKGRGVAGWTTLQTLTPSITAQTWSASLIECRATGWSSLAGGGGGTRVSRWQVLVSNGPPAATSTKADEASGVSPQLRLQTQGSAILVQVASSDAVRILPGGVVVCDYAMSDAEGGPQVTWAMN